MKIEALFSVAGKTAVVTGGSRGIGEMIARALIENGANVIITSRKISDCEGLAAQLGPACTAIRVANSRMFGEMSVASTCFTPRRALRTAWMVAR